MSKMDALRAMREARYAERTAPPAGTAAPPKRAPRPPVAPAETPERVDWPADEDDVLCGHRAISGRTCTRERGHAAKSHRYS